MLASHALTLPQRLWKWTKWALLVFAALIVVVVIFHKPLILWALNRFGPGAASRAGLNLEWKVSGSLWSDLSIDSIKASSIDSSLPITHLSVGKASLKYDLHPLWQRDYTQIAKSIVLHDVNATIDLRHPAPAKKPKNAKPVDKQAVVNQVKSFGWPDIDLRNINVTVLLPGQTLTIGGFDLNLPSGKEGTLHVTRVEHPQLAQYPLHDVTGKVRLGKTSFVLDDLKLPPDVELKHLEVDAAEYGNGVVKATTRIRSGAAELALDGKVDLSGERPLIEAIADVTGINEKEVARWWQGMPPDIAVRMEKLHVVAKGDPLRPDQLDATVSLGLRDAAYQAYRSEAADLDVKLAGGKMEATQLQVNAGGNRIDVTGQGTAPPTWAGFATVPLTAQWKLTAPTLQSMAGLPVKISGGADGEGTVELADKRLRHFTAKIAGKDVALDQRKVRTLDVSASGDLRSIDFAATALADAGDGKLEAKGTVGLVAGALSKAQWNLVLPRPDELARSLAVTWPADVSTGEVSANGDAEFELAKLKASQFNDAKGQGTVTIQQATWRQAPSEKIALAWRLADGKATVPSLTVTLPGNSAIRVEGSMVLGGDQTFEGSVQADLPDAAALQPWMDAATRPAPALTPDLVSPNQPAPASVPTPQPGATTLHSGAVMLAWKGSGQLKQALKVNGSATVNVDKVRYGTLAEAVSLDTTFDHDLEGANIQSLVANFGPWAAKLNGAVTKRDIDLPALEVAHAGKALLKGSVKVPLDMQAKPVPVDPNRPMKVQIDTVEKLRIEDLAKIGNAKLPEDLAGAVSTTIHLDGLLPQLQSHIEVKIDDLKVPKVQSKERGQVELTVDLKDGQLNVNSVANIRPFEPAELHAKAKLDVPALLDDPKRAMDTPFEASVKLNQPSLEFIKPFVPKLQEIKAGVKIDAVAKGTPRSPTIQGTLDLDATTIALDDPDLPLIKDLKARVVADGTTVKVESLHAIAAGGEVSMTGTCELKDLTKPAFDVSLKAKEMLIIRNDQMSFRTDADLRCQGVPTAATLTGSVDLTRGRVFQEVNFLPVTKLMNDLPPLPDAKVKTVSLDQTAAAAASPLPPMFKDWTFNVNVKTKDAIRLLGNVLNGDVVVDVAATGNGAVPQVIGRVNLDQARLILPFSTLRIKTGNINFERDHPLEPTLDLVAESTVDIYDITLRGYGPVTNPKMRFTSTPPLPEGEIATLLATGSTTTGLTKASDDAAGRLLFFAVKEAYRRTFKKKPSVKKPGEKDSESRFTVQERSEDGKLGGVTATYEFSRKTKIVGSTNKEGGFRAMFYYLFRFD